MVGATGEVWLTNQDVVADADVAVSPGNPAFLGHGLFKSPSSGLRLVARSPVRAALHFAQLVFHGAGDGESEVHVRRLLELSFALETIWIGAVPWSSDPADAVVGVKRLSLGPIRFAENLHAVIVDEDVGGPALEFVRGNGFLDGHDGRQDDFAQALFVHRALDSDVWQIVSESGNGVGAVVFRVSRHLLNWSDQFGAVDEDDVKEEHAQEHPDRGQGEERKPKIRHGDKPIFVEILNDQLSKSKAQCCNDATQ